MRGPEPLAYFRAMERAIDQGAGYTEAVVVNPERVPGAGLGDRFLFDGEGRAARTLAAPAFASDVLVDRVLPLDERPRPRRRARGRVPAELAAHPAGDRGRRARRAGRRGTRGPGRLRRLGGRRPSPVRQRRTIPDRRSGSSSGRSTRSSAIAGDHAADLRPDRHPRPRPRPGGALPPGADARVVCRADRQPPQDPADLRGPARAGHPPTTHSSGSPRRSGWTSARRPSSRSPSASWPS